MDAINEYGHRTLNCYVKGQSLQRIKLLLSSFHLEKCSIEDMRSAMLNR